MNEGDWSVNVIFAIGVVHIDENKNKWKGGQVECGVSYQLMTRVARNTLVMNLEPIYLFNQPLAVECDISHLSAMTWDTLFQVDAI